MCNRKSLVVVLVSLTLVFGTASSGFCFGKKELETEQGAVKLLREVERGGYKIVTTEELKSWMDEKKDMLIIDTMPYEASYKKNHVAGAVQFLFPKAGDMKEWDTSETDGKSKEDYVKLLGEDKNKTIVVYCGFVACDRSHNGAMWAVKLGYTNVYRYPGGIKAWTEADYPIGKVK
jgi:thiosulfate/3-mercaptopyruvate sulfurtransferase